ncbi:uncharacterized protein BDZ99DRAFT_33922 [Mytilinidion resinicola]|uniref:Uncharacterized protein n=1 Tax=Mytilinidion resinicola TaxID=574789 RepID=A0A6A6YLB7_9PEZI|nr:uncharacterized protein BDZ99DRAFT_33922 [Mytilinidion resinicola]KAF2809672.1 hypothetical protein BDZ99DRAFT_33922 [Mytilinidion resinicola]
MTSYTSPIAPTSPPYALSQDPVSPLLQSCTVEPAIAAVRSKIAASASLNSSLLNLLMLTMDAPAALGHMSTHITILRTELSAHSVALEALQKKALQTLRRHELFRDSIVRRLTYRITAMTAKFREKSHVAEKEYTETVKELSRAETRLKLLAAKLQEAEQERKKLEQQAAEHREAHRKIDELYESVFAGPTPGFAEEDKRESAYDVALQNLERTKKDLLAARKAVRSLVQTGNAFKRAGNFLVHAVNAVDASFFLALSGAEEEIKTHERYRTMALSLVEHTKDSLRPMDRKAEEVAKRLSDTIRKGVVNLEDISSKQLFLDSVAEAGKDLNEAAVLLDQLKALVKEKERTAAQNLGQTARALEDARQALQEVRQEAFEKVVGFGAAPPAYHECCDRSSQFEEAADDGSVLSDTFVDQEFVDAPSSDAHSPQTPSETTPYYSPSFLHSNAFSPSPDVVSALDPWAPSRKLARG